MTYLVEIKKDYALPLLEVLQQQDAIVLHKNPAAPAEAGAAERKIDFSLLQLDTRGFKFDRDEANER